MLTSNHNEDTDDLDEYLCPITYELMVDPVSVAGCGHTFERAAIKKWFDEGHTLCPSCNQRVPNKELYPNVSIRSLILRLKEKNSGENQKFISTTKKLTEKLKIADAEKRKLEFDLNESRRQLAKLELNAQSAKKGKYKQRRERSYSKKINRGNRRKNQMVKKVRIEGRIDQEQRIIINALKERCRDVNKNVRFIDDEMGIICIDEDYGLVKKLPESFFRDLNGEVSYSLLSLAASAGYDMVVTYLLDNRANPSAPNMSTTEEYEECDDFSDPDGGVGVIYHSEENIESYPIDMAANTRCKNLIEQAINSKESPSP